MCGIYGSIGPADRDELSLGARSLNHRGPDAFSEYDDPENSVYLAFCRLSILDLSDRASQPMLSEDRQVAMVFNGEIYNFRELRGELEKLGAKFHTTGDAEVVLKAYQQWGRSFLERLHGMFAIGIWNRRTKTLLLARDRMGVKPLYVWRHNGSLAFASEPKAFLTRSDFKRDIDHAGFASFLLYGYVIGRQSIWRNVDRLPPATWAEFDAESGSWKEGVYWRLENRQTNWGLKDAGERLDELLNDVVGSHLVSDVPVGVLLSGGLDSSLIASYASSHHPGLKSFTIGFADWPLSETEDAANIAGILDMPHHVQTLTKSSFGIPATVLDNFDEPLADTGIFPTASVCKLARQHATVALSGDGGDELFGGYNWYVQMESNPVRRRLAFFVESMRRRLGIGREWPHGLANDGEYYRFLHAPSFNLRQIFELFPWVNRDVCTERLAALSNGPLNKQGSRYRRRRLFDAETYLVDNNLTRVDRVSMAYGLEVRVPLLDHRLVEFAFTLPDELTISQDETKVLLRDAARRKLNAKNINKLKQGFSCPIQRYWPANEMADSLRDGALVQNQIIDGKSLHRLLDGPQYAHTPYQIWVLAALDRWCQTWYSRREPGRILACATSVAGC